MSAPVAENHQFSWLDRPVFGSKWLNVERLIYLILIALAIFTRFWMLGDRTMSHDESLHTFYSWNLYKGGGFSHTPLMHGPFKFDLNALIYSLFGADDFTARISVAVFGVVLVSLPYFLRRWLGRIGALLASFMLLISPSIWYHARYIRDEAFMLVWIMLMVWGIFAYLHRRERKWLILMAGVMAFAYLSMEATFIFCIVFGAFLSVTALIELSVEKNFWRGIVGRVALGLAVAALIAMGVVVVQTLLFNLVGLGPGSSIPAPTAPGQPAETGGQLSYLLQIVGLAARIVLAAGVPMLVIAVAVYYWFKFILPDRIRESRSLDLAIIILTMSLFMASAGALVILNPLWKQFTGLDFVNVNFFTDGNFPTNDLGPVMRLVALAGAFVAMSLAIGWWWNRRTWLISTALFLGITATLYTTVFTNGIGLGTGFVGSLGYWLKQQDVQRGSQPLYYYFVVTPLYEYLPMLISIIATITYVIRWIRQRAILPHADWDLRLIVPFLIWWCFAAWLAFSYAGEKMPWLMVYLALPMVVLSARFLGEWFESINWRAIITERQWLAGGLLAVAVISGAWLLGNTRPVLSGQDLETLKGFGGLAAAAVVFGFALWGLWAMKPRPTWHVLGRMAGLIGLLALAILTIHTGWQWNYVNYDLALEFGVYAHGGPGVKEAMSQIDAIAARTTGGKANLKIAFDADASWPYYWYLRDYPNKAQIPNSPSRTDLEAPVLLLSSSTWGAVDSVLSRTHTSWQSHRIWWPMEDYKKFAECPFTEIDPATGASVNVAAYDENNDGTIDATEKRNGQLRCDAYYLRTLPADIQSLANWLIFDPDRRSALVGIFLNRDYTQYDRIMNETHKPENWPLVDDFRLYVQRDLASQVWTEATAGSAPAAEVPQDPYAAKWKNVDAVQVFGTAGSAAGQFQSPQGIAVAGDGSIYVADSLNHRIQKFDPSGKYVATLGGPVAGSAPGQFKEPWDVAVAKDGTIYVADTWNHRIQYFKPDGTLIATWGTNMDSGGKAQGFESGFYGPRGIAVDPQGHVVVADTGNKRVQIFQSDGTFVKQFGGAGLQPGSLDEPVGVAVDAKGNIVVADTWNGRVQVFNSDGSPVANWDINGWLDKNAVGKPYVAVDSKGRVYVADQVGRRILVFDQSGQYLGSFGQYGTDASGFSLPGGIAIDKEDNVYVVDSALGRVLKYPPFQP